MARGFCEVCGRCVPIGPHSQKLGSRELEWRPLPHDGCNGHKYDILNHPEPLPPIGTLVGPDPVEAVLKSDYEAFDDDPIDSTPKAEEGKLPS